MDSRFDSRILNINNAGIIRTGDDSEAGWRLTLGEVVFGEDGKPGHHMDVAHLYLELLECGDCLAQALAEERKAIYAGRNSCNSRERWRRARWEVGRAAEYYAIALRAYRIATLSEFVPAGKQASKPKVRSGTAHRAGKSTNGRISGTGFHARRRSKLQ